jgi:hypothetical protein
MLPWPPSDEKMLATPIRGLTDRVSQMTDPEAAWDELHDARPDHWYVGRPVDNKPGEWTMYAFDPRERKRRRARTPHA